MTAGAAPLWIRVLRFAFAVSGVLALVWIPIRNIGESGFSAANYFSYFTIESNVLGVIVLLIGAGCDPRDRRWQVVRDASLLVLTGVFVLLAVASIGGLASRRPAS
ncbi:hypothetical protein [Nocardia australiensis]|uniref:hypothetical protein n=1 Tax=Nocardia australiensis TaxID=2887191 RepID=UPI001D1485B5|nr:hypothetical protein [Nocardia australiensis]